MKINILVAGVGGASLGTEIIKCLKLREEIYNIYVCDISPMAFGLYEENLKGFFLSDLKNYCDSIIDICKKVKIEVIVPGGEQPMRLLNPLRNIFNALNVQIASNTEEVVNLCSNKALLFKFLNQNNIPSPKTYELNEDAVAIKFPCIIKPSEDSGGSAFVSIANDLEDIKIFCSQIQKSGRTPIIQEYLPIDEGEYTFSILSDLDGNIFGGIGIKKNFDIKLMYTYKASNAIISSGYSQGLIDKFPEIIDQVFKIAMLVKSKGPLNIEGRVLNGIFYPFEINPRFSASTYLWAKAGFNDIDYFIRILKNRKINDKINIKRGMCLRSLSEKFIDEKAIIAR